jgi:hypothetical protein
VLADPATLERALRGGEAEEVLSARAVAKLAADPAFVETARRAGLLPPREPGAPAGSVERQIAAGLVPVARVAATLLADPEVRKLLADPGLRDKLQRQDMVALARDPGFNRIAQLVLERLRTTRNQP